MSPVAIRALGSHGLKHFESEQWLFDLVVDGLVADFPPIRTLADTVARGLTREAAAESW